VEVGQDVELKLRLPAHDLLEENLRNLSRRLARGAYRTKPAKRTYIAKTDVLVHDKTVVPSVPPDSP
jgi:hypothetical protein